MLQLTGSFISISLLENFKLITEPCSNTPLKGFFLSDVNQQFPWYFDALYQRRLSASLIIPLWQRQLAIILFWMTTFLGCFQIRWHEQAIWQGAEKNEKLCGNFGQYYAEESANYAEKTTDYAEISNETIAASQLISKKTITASPLTSNKTITATPLISTQSTVKTINGNINKLLPRIWVHYIF